MITTLQVVATAIVALAMPSDAPTQETVILAARIGITPESLVVAGFSANESAAIVDTLGTNGDYAAMMLSAESLVAAKSAVLASAQAALTASPGNETLLSARNAARSDLASASAALAAVPASIRTALLAEADGGKKSMLETYISSAGRFTPHEFKAISRTAAEWTALEGALRAEARASRRGEELAETRATLLSNARADETVAAAKTRLDNTLAAVKATFTPAQEQQEQE